jgi:hypothetical protein
LLRRKGDRAVSAPQERPPATLFGIDYYLWTLLLMIGVGVGGAIWWLFFTNLPLPNHCAGLHLSSCEGGPWIYRPGSQYNDLRPPP